jgi:hypothetical protein
MSVAFPSRAIPACAPANLRTNMTEVGNDIRAQVQRQRPPSLTGSGASRFDLHSTSAALVTLPDTYRRILLRDPVIFLG